MANLPNSSNPSAICPHGPESAAGNYLWRPSGACALALSILGVLAPLSVLASGLPAPVAWPLALLACLHGVCIVRGYLGVRSRHLLIPSSGETRCEDLTMIDLRVRWRGPLAFVAWRSPSDRHQQRLVFWPDRLDVAMRRELRLAMRAREAALGRASVAR